MNLSRSNKRGSLKDDPWKSLVVGATGGGKSFTSLKETLERAQPRSYNQRRGTNPYEPEKQSEYAYNLRLKEQEPKVNQPELPKWGYYPSHTDNSRAPSSQSNTDGNAAQYWSNEQASQQSGGNQEQYRQWRWTDTGTSGTNPYIIPGIPYAPSPFQQQIPKTETAPKHTTEELKGKLVAFATITIDGKEHRGVLFVRKCGAWKLIECETMKKIASGSEKDPMPEVAIHYVIYSQFDNKKKKKGRFEDIDMKEPEDISDGAKK